MFRFSLAIAASAGFSVALGAPQEVTLDLDAVGPEFDGLGAVSAGTGPRLLIDYEEPVRSHILDLLFRPDFGAGVQVLKIEIGGAGDSSQGTEASHEPVRGKIEPDAGYEFWVASEARRRNPDIAVYGLAWNFPGWVVNNSEASFGANVARYLLDWLTAAEKYHGLRVDIIGWQNEAAWAVDDVVALRRLMDGSGFAHVALALADCGPNYQTSDMVERIRGDTELDRAAAIVGHHYPLSILPTQKNLTFWEGLWTLKQKIWASEDYSTYTDSNGARCLAKLFNRNYVDGNLTATLVWDMLWSSFDGLACAGCGLMWAAEPWSGTFGALDGVWAMAHTTQFASRKGWRYLKKPTGAGYLPKPEAFGEFWGSYVTLVSEDHVTIVVETMNDHESKCSYGNNEWANVTYTASEPRARAVHFCMSSCGSNRSLTVFSTTIDEEGKGPRFERQQDKALDASCCFHASIARNSLWTFSTVSSAKKGALVGEKISKPPEGISLGCAPFDQPAAATKFPFPYATNFSDTGTAVRFHDFPVYLSDVKGVFRVNQTTGVLRQISLTPSSDIVHNNQDPTAVLGDKSWTDYKVWARTRLSADAPDSYYVAVYARFGHDFSFHPGGGYALRLYSSGAWNITVQHTNGAESALASGAVGKSRGVWREIALSVVGSAISASIDGVSVGQAIHREWASGLAGLGCGWHPGEFSTFGVARAADEVLSV